MKKLLIFIFITTFNINVESKDPYDDDLKGLNLICSNDSLSIQDWGLTFKNKKKVKLFSLDKKLYEVFQYQRSYRTDARNIIILKNEKIDFIINRTRLMLSNKKCKIVDGDPLLILQEKIIDIQSKRREGNKL